MRMKKSLFLGISLLLSATALAQDFPTVAFEENSGEITYLKSDNLNINFTSDALVVTHADGETSFPLADLNKFYFSDVAACVSTSLIDENAEVCVFSISGENLGTFSSPSAAINNLPIGVYVFKSDSKTFKVNIK